MRIIPVVLLILFFSSNALFSQQFYFKAIAGYGIGTSQDNLTSEGTIVIDDKSYNTLESKDYSFGKGLNINVSAGYFISPNLGAELDLGYLKSDPVNMSQNYIFDEESINGNIEFTSHTYTITPSVFVNTEYMGLKPYAKFGIIVAFPEFNRDYVDKIVYENGDPTKKMEMVFQYYGGIALGISSTIGISYRLYKVSNLVFEISNKNLSYAPEKMNLTKMEYNGSSILDEEIKKGYHSDFIDKVSTYVVDGSTRKSLKTRYAYSSLSFSLGVMVEL